MVCSSLTISCFFFSLISAIRIHIDIGFYFSFDLNHRNILLKRIIWHLLNKNQMGFWFWYWKLWWVMEMLNYCLSEGQSRINLGFFFYRRETDCSAVELKPSQFRRGKRFSFSTTKKKLAMFVCPETATHFSLGSIVTCQFLQNLEN